MVLFAQQVRHSIERELVAVETHAGDGAGDSMVAGFLAGYLEKGDYEYALKLGTASGGATAFSYGIGTKELIMELLGQLQ